MEGRLRDAFERTLRKNGVMRDDIPNLAETLSTRRGREPGRFAVSFLSPYPLADLDGLVQEALRYAGCVGQVEICKATAQNTFTPTGAYLQLELYNMRIRARPASRWRRWVAYMTWQLLFALLVFLLGGLATIWLLRSSRH